MAAIACRLLTAGALILTGSTVSPSLAQTGADFFKGKAVTYIVATAPGGGYDLYGRLVSEYMQRYLPGSTFIVKNIPGAGNIVGTNTLLCLEGGRTDDRHLQHRPDLRADDPAAKAFVSTSPNCRGSAKPRPTRA